MTCYVSRCLAPADVSVNPAIWYNPIDRRFDKIQSVPRSTLLLRQALSHAASLTWEEISMNRPGNHSPLEGICFFTLRYSSKQFQNEARAIRGRIYCSRSTARQATQGAVLHRGGYRRRKVVTRVRKPLSSQRIGWIKTIGGPSATSVGTISGAPLFIAVHGEVQTLLSHARRSLREKYNDQPNQSDTGQRQNIRSHRLLVSRRGPIGVAEFRSLPYTSVHRLQSPTEMDTWISSR